MPRRNNLYIGPSGWARPDWTGPVWAKRMQDRRHTLRTLSEYVNLAEIERTFLEPLKPEIAKLYVKQTEGREEFLFTALMGRQFTHDRNVDAAAVMAWKAGFQPLLRAGRLGALVMQFPWAFRFNDENRQFLIQLRRAFHEFPLAAEMRHDSWLRDEAVTTLVDYRIGTVNVDQPEYFRGMPPGAQLTSGVAVVRLHGRRNPEAYQEFDGRPAGTYLYDLDELLEWKPRIERLTANATRTLVITANGAGGRSLVNALQLREILREGELVAPPGLLGRYPAELAAFRSTRPVQQVLLPAHAA